ncbi:MAG: pyruvate ferredoxin oxidoreductase [Deltaproteobacteria bacterium]|nr:pyruvate ferredoxin oxidoreductase [Deltaproteobacteria bacterium]
MYKIKFHGIGGQGVVTATKLLAQSVGISENKYSKTMPAYGHERRGAPVYSDIIIDDSEILLNSFVYSPDIVIIFDPFIIQKDIDISKGIHSDSQLLINCGNKDFVNGNYGNLGFNKITYVDARAIALEHTGREIPNITMLGALSSMGIVKLSSVDQTLKEYFNEKEYVRNEQAIKEAFKSAKEL